MLCGVTEMNIVESIKKMGIEMGNLKLTEKKCATCDGVALPMYQLMLYIWSNKFYGKLVEEHCNFIFKFEKMLKDINDISKTYVFDTGTDLKMCFKIILNKKRSENPELLKSFCNFIEGKESKHLTEMYETCLDIHGDVYMLKEDESRLDRFVENVKIESA